MFSTSHKERAFQLPWRPSTLSKSLAILPFKFDYKFFCIPMRFSAWNCIKVYIFSDRLYETEGSYKIRLVHSLQRVNIPHGRCLLTLIKKSRPQEGRYTKTRSTCENLYISLLRLLQIRRLDQIVTCITRDILTLRPLVFLAAGLSSTDIALRDKRAEN